MTRLLVSVRDAAEARIALESGVDLIDVKEPQRGALGPADPSVWQEVLDAVAGRVPVSCALGELTDIRQGDTASIPDGMRYMKVGLAGAANLNNWVVRWREIVDRRPPACEVVAVIYADGARAQAPNADQILAAARSLPCAAVLVDTFDKQSGNVFQHWPSEFLASLLGQARDSGLLTVLGGGLCWNSLASALALPADYLAVRGLACREGRTSAIDPAACRRLARQVHGKSAFPISG